MVLDRTMFHYENLAATWLDQAQRNNLLTDCSSAGTQGREGRMGERKRRRERGGPANWVQRRRKWDATVEGVLNDSHWSSSEELTTGKSASMTITG